MRLPRLDRYVSQGVTLLGDLGRPGGVTFAFSERTGGCSAGEFQGLNLGDRCGDDPAAVARNRSLALAALGAGGLEARLVNPWQVHGDRVVEVLSPDEASVARAQAQAQEGADAVVCVAPGVPVLLCFADCVPVVLACEGGFAVVHSGWRGTVARVAVPALDSRRAASGCGASEVRAYVGPHIAGEDYEVSPELLARFSGEFGPAVALPGNHLDLARAVVQTLVERGMGEDMVLDCGVSTPRSADRFYSYRAEGGRCGRHGALAVLGV